MAVQTQGVKVRAARGWFLPEAPRGCVPRLFQLLLQMLASLGSVVHAVFPLPPSQKDSAPTAQDHLPNSDA